MRPSAQWLLPRKLPWRSALFDVGFAAILMSYLLLTAGRADFEFHEPLWVDLLEGVAVAVRRMWTVPAAAAMLVVAGTSEVAHWPYPLGVGVLVFTVAAMRLSRWISLGYATVAALLLIIPSPYAELARSWEAWSQITPEALLLTSVPLFAGLYSQQRQNLIDSLRVQAKHSERQRRLEAERIRADERSKLANEIHDVVAHSVSLMIVHSGALKLAATDQRTREIADMVRSSGRLALEELRDLVGVLRQGDMAPLGPAPNLANLDALVDESRMAGSVVMVHSRGTPQKVSGAVERTAYRVVQEALTNTRKHAPGAPVRIDLTWYPSSLDISVRNDPPSGKAPEFPEGGHGIESLRERVSLLSGQFNAGPTAEGGWRVYASLPTGGS